MAGLGATGYAIRRDLTPLARWFFWALIALIAFRIVLLFVEIPGGALTYAIAGLVIFAVRVCKGTLAVATTVSAAGAGIAAYRELRRACDCGVRT